MYVDIVWDNIADGKQDQFETFRFDRAFPVFKYYKSNSNCTACTKLRDFGAKGSTIPPLKMHSILSFFLSLSFDRWPEKIGEWLAGNLMHLPDRNKATTIFCNMGNGASN